MHLLFVNYHEFSGSAVITNSREGGRIAKFTEVRKSPNLKLYLFYQMGPVSGPHGKSHRALSDSEVLNPRDMRASKWTHNLGHSQDQYEGGWPCLF